MMLDYIWNAWHFAAQHAGISRIYGRTARSEQTSPHAEFEKMAIRMLVLWVFFRFAIHMAIHSKLWQRSRWLSWWLQWLDPVALRPADHPVAREVSASVLSVWAGSLHRQRHRDLLGPARRDPPRKHVVDDGVLLRGGRLPRSRIFGHLQLVGAEAHHGHLALSDHRTGLALFVFMAILGTANYFVDRECVYAWQLITLLVSLLHYGYDGIIWRAFPASSGEINSPEQLLQKASLIGLIASSATNPPNPHHPVREHLQPSHQSRVAYRDIGLFAQIIFPG